MAGHVSATYEANAYHTTYAYDAAGNLTQITDPYGYATTFVYDPLNRQSQRYSAQPGVLTTHVYDAAGRETSRGAVLSPNPDYVPQLFSCACSYDAAGNMTARSIASEDVEGSSSYSYDHANQLTGEATNFAGGVAFVTTYVYDAVGNRLVQAQQNLAAYGSAPALTTTSYDAASQITTVAYCQRRLKIPQIVGRKFPTVILWRQLVCCPESPAVVPLAVCWS